MTGNDIGIVFGTEFVRIAVREKNKICGEICEKIPESFLLDGKIFSLDLAAEFLKEVGRKNGLSRYRACVVLPEDQVITKRVRMVEMDRKRLMLNLPYEFYDYLENSREEWIYDYCVAEEGDLFAAAVPARIVTWYQKLIHQAGWKLAAMAPASSALANLIRCGMDPEHQKQQDCCVMDFGKKEIKLYFYQNGLLFAKHEIERLAKEAVNFELEKTWDFYQECFPKRSPRRIYFTGEDRRNSMEKEIAQNLGAEGCDWTELLRPRQEIPETLVSAEAAGITFWRE